MTRVDLFSYDPPVARAAALIDRGIAASAASAADVDPGWGNDALDLFRRYAVDHLTFMTEDVRAWAYEQGFPKPPAEGAWGAVARRAKSLGWIDALGKTASKNPSQHGKMMTTWPSRLPEGRP